MNILCSICSEFMKSDEEIVVTTCGHLYHRHCIESWLNTSRTCPTCRSGVSASSLIKVFFENDQSRANDLHNELIKNNEKLTKDFNEISEKCMKFECEVSLANAKVRELSEKVKGLERAKQLDDMALAGLKLIKEESAKEILKLTQQMQTVKLDLLAEKQLRRIHQTTLHRLDPKNENYDIARIGNEEQMEILDNSMGKQGAYSINPFWQLSCEAKINEKKTDKPYVIPSKIQKSNPIEIRRTLLNRCSNAPNKTWRNPNINKTLTLSLADPSTPNNSPEIVTQPQTNPFLGTQRVLFTSRLSLENQHQFPSSSSSQDATTSQASNDEPSSNKNNNQNNGNIDQNRIVFSFNPNNNNINASDGQSTSSGMQAKSSVPCSSNRGTFFNFGNAFASTPFNFNIFRDSQSSLNNNSSGPKSSDR